MGGGRRWDGWGGVSVMGEEAKFVCHHIESCIFPIRVLPFVLQGDFIRANQKERYGRRGVVKYGLPPVDFNTKILEYERSYVKQVRISNHAILYIWFILRVLTFFYLKGKSKPILKKILL